MSDTGDRSDDRGALREARATSPGLDEVEALRGALRRSEERFRRIFDHSNDAIFLVDVENDAILDVNARACQMLGFTRDEFHSLPMSAIHPNEMARIRAFAKSVFDSGSGFTDELSCLTKKGDILRAEISATIVPLDDRLCMVASVRDVSERVHLTRVNKYLSSEFNDELRFGSIIGRSPEIRDVLKQIEAVAPTDASVLITGESGTGKELVARAIHEHSQRAEQVMVRVNCASVPAELFESEFFGHVKGSFTGAIDDRVGRFELANGGTLFLDEVGEIPLALQSKLLRVLQEGEFERVGENRTRQVDVRVIAATNRDLLPISEGGGFRPDLYYRLSVFTIELPPLRDRKEDIGSIAQHCVERSLARLGRRPLHLSDAQIRQLESYAWPGNVRELQNVVERAVILGKADRLRFDLADEPRLPDAHPEPPGAGNDMEDLSLEDLKRLERDLIVRALDQTGWKIYGEGGAAAALGLKPSTLASRMKRMSIERPG